VRLSPSLQPGSATAPEMATVNSRSTPWHHPQVHSSPPTQDPVGPAGISVRSQAGSSCRTRRSSKARRFTASRRRGRRTNILKPASIGYFMVAGGCPGSARLPDPRLRGTTDYHDQHKPTQPAPCPEPSGLLLLGVETAAQRPYHMAPAIGLEPITCRLTAGRSAD
jgi:hypothetical protein